MSVLVIRDLKKHQGLMISMTLALLFISVTHSIACSRSSKLTAHGLHGWPTDRKIHRIKIFTLIAYVLIVLLNLLSFGLFCIFNISTTKAYISTSSCPIDL